MQNIKEATYNSEQHSYIKNFRRAAREKQTYRTDLSTWAGEGEEGKDEMFGKRNMETYITICKIDSQQEFAV